MAAGHQHRHHDHHVPDGIVIQQSQNEDSVAVHLKLNELLASNHQASNRLIGIEDASENDLRRIAAAYLELAEKAGRGASGEPHVSKTVEAARAGVNEEGEPKATRVQS